jgi:uncharacterized protein (TIRG00374 family)
MKLQKYKPVIVNLLSRLRKFIPIVGIIIFALLIIDIGIGKISDVFLSIPIINVIIVVLLLIPRVLLSSIKWWIICRKQKIIIGKFYLVKLFLICLFYENITPASIGSFIGVYYLKEKSNISWEKSFTNSLLDNTVDFIIILFLALIGSFLIFEYYPGVLPTLLLVFIIVIIFFFFLMKEQRGNLFFKIFIRPFIINKIKVKFEKSIVSLYEDIPSLKEMIFPFLVGICVWIIYGLQVYIIAYAFSINVPLNYFIFIFFISVIIGLMPISVGGLGLREGTLVALLLIFGVPPETTFVISLSSHILCNMVPGFIGGIISITQKKF